MNFNGVFSHVRCYREFQIHIENKGVFSVSIALNATLNGTIVSPLVGPFVFCCFFFSGSFRIIAPPNRTQKILPGIQPGLSVSS